MTPYTIPEVTLCAEVNPDALARHLTTQGYRRLAYNPTKGYAIYAPPNDDPHGDIEAPTNPAFGDYGRRVYECLECLDGPFLGLLHTIDPVKFPCERILVLVGVTV